MVVLHSCKNEEIPIKNEGAREGANKIICRFSDAQGQLTPKSAVEFCRNSSSSKLLELPWLPARMKKIHQNEGARVLTRFSPF